MWHFPGKEGRQTYMGHNEWREKKQKVEDTGKKQKCASCRP